MFNGFPIDQQGTYLPNGRANWKGEATLYIISISYGISGTWRVKDGRLDYKVEASSVPNIIPIGYTGYVEIIAVTAEEFA